MTQASLQLNLPEPEPANPARRIRELADYIRQMDHAYHNENQSHVSDHEYDRLKSILVQLEQQHPDLVHDDSPTRRVGGQAEPRFTPVTHLPPMLSLANAFSVDDFSDWRRRTAALLGRHEFPMHAELKIDGLAVRLDYRQGQLALAATRGDGHTGEDVTANLLTVKNLPHALPALGSRDIQVRGEVYLPKTTFHEINATRAARGQRLYANARNAAAGTVRQTNRGSASTPELSVWIYSLVQSDGVQSDGVQSDGVQSHRHSSNLRQLAATGLPVEPHSQLCHDLDDVTQFYAAMLRLRPELEYEADGIVVKVDDTRLYPHLGSTGHEPRWAIAWKFPADRTTTRLNAISVSVGRFGKLTPVAEMKPVALDGVTVRRASLHNESDLRRKDIRAGDDVVLERAGGVIPQVISPVNNHPERDTVPFTMPTECPICAAPVRQDPGKVAHWCPNVDCGSRQIEALKHFVSQPAMDIDGFGPALCEQLAANGLVQNPGDIYRLTVEQIAPLDHQGTKSAQRIVRNIDESRNTRSLQRILYSLGIHRLGRHVSGILAAEYDSLEQVRALSITQLAQHRGISAKIAQSVTDGFQTQRVIDTIQALYDHGVHPHQERPHTMTQTVNNPFTGMNICLTGALPGMTRNEAHHAIIALGGTPHSSVTKSTHVLVVGGKPGAKVKKAQQNGATIWDQDTFLQRLTQAGYLQSTGDTPLL